MTSMKCRRRNGLTMKREKRSDIIKQRTRKSHRWIAVALVLAMLVPFFVLLAPSDIWPSTILEEPAE